MIPNIYKAVLIIISVLITRPATAQIVNISNGTQVMNTGTMVLEDASLVNNGSFTNADWANVVFKGSGDRFIQGNGSTQFYGLHLNKTANNLLLQTNIKVAGNLLFTKGSLDLGSNSVQLIYPKGLLQNETDSTRIFSNGNGIVFIEQPLNAPNYVDPGNLGFSIFSAQNMGTTVVYRGYEAQTNASQQQSIKRYFRVVPTYSSNMLCNVRYTYLDAELGNLPEPGMALFQKVGAGVWAKVPNNGISNPLNFRESLGLTSLDWFTLFSENGNLPLQLLAFTAQCRDNSVLLQWITANEVGTKGFAIEQSADAATWKTVQTVAAAGNTAQHTYSTPVADNTASYYRLKMEDKDGKFAYSPVRKTNCNGSDIITVGPNPTTGPLNISFQLAKKDNGVIQLLDAKGSILQSRIFKAPQGLSIETLNMSPYPAGSYLVRISSANGLQETKQIIRR